MSIEYSCERLLEWFEDDNSDPESTHQSFAEQAEAIYARDDDPSEIDCIKIDSILQHLDNLIMSWYPTTSSTKSVPSMSLETPNVSFPHLIRQIDIISTFHAQQQHQDNSSSPASLPPSPTSQAYQQPLTKPNEINSRDQLTSFSECELSASCLLEYLSGQPPTTTIPMLDSSIHTIPLPHTITSSKFYSFLSTTLLFFTLHQNGVYVPLFHTFLCEPFLAQLFHCVQLLPILFVTLLVGYDLHTVFFFYFFPGLTALDDYYDSDTPPWFPTPDNPFGVSLLPLVFFKPSTILPVRILGWCICLSYITFVTIGGICTLWCLYRTFLTPISLPEHRPAFGYFAESQRRLLYTYYIALLQIFPASYRDSIRPPSHSAPVLRLPVPPSAKIPPLLKEDGRFRRFLLLCPDTLLCMDRCKHCIGDAYRPSGSHHCRTCGKCTPGYDHHCPWVATDLGTWNHKFFLQFVTWASISCLSFLPCGVFSLYLSADALFTQDLDEVHTWAFVRLFGMFFTTLLTGCLGLVLAVFAGFHLNMVISQTTTLEKMSQKSSKQHGNDINSLPRHLAHHRIQSSQVDDLDQQDLAKEPISANGTQQWKVRLLEMFGPNPLYWLFPIDSMFVATHPRRYSLDELIEYSTSVTSLTNIASLHQDNAPLSLNNDHSDEEHILSQHLTSSADSMNDRSASSCYRRAVDGVSNDTCANFFFQKQLYLEDDFFYPYSFTHHLFPKLTLLVPEHYTIDHSENANVDNNNI